MDANWIICLILMFITYSDADLTNIRLVDGNSSTEGRVEVLYNGEWGTVCDDYFDEKDAAVVCSMLGHSRTNAKAKHKAFFGQGSGRILMDDLQCTDNDTNLFTCEQNCIGSHNCMHGEDAGVECSIYTGPKIRLVGGSNPSEGRVEVYYKNEWGTVCDDSWDSKDASVVCFTLGYSRENAVPKSLAHFGQGEDRIWIDDVTCQGTEKDFFDCYKTMEYHNCYHFEDAGVICSQEGAVRLAGGNISSEGRVEIYNNGSWGTICDKLWDDVDAEVVCAMLGFPSEGACARKGGYFSPGEDNAMHMLDDVNCTGTENSIIQCSHRGVQHTDCSHINDAGVTCINEMPKDCGVADILIIIDDSNGSEGFNISNMKTLAKEIIKDLNSMLFGFSVLRYSSSVSKMFGLIEFSRLPDVIPSLDRIRYFPDTSTDTDKALKYARVSIFNSMRADAANIIILLTDGLPNNLNKTKAESDLLRKQGVRIFSVGVGNETKTEGLSLIASSPSDEHVFQVTTLGDLSLIINAVQNKTCKVEEDEDTTRSQTQPTIITIPTSIIDQCFAQVDLVFVLDSSTSVGYDNYDLMKGFVTKFLRKVNIDNGGVRVGLLSYSTKVTVEFKLNSYNTKADLFDAVNAIPWRYGSTNTADGLQTMHEEMFNETNGDRPGVPNICIIMTDGVSNINYRRTIPEAEIAREKGIHIYAIGITLKDLKEVNEIANSPASTNVFTVNTFDELEDLDEKIFAATCLVTTTLPTTTTTKQPEPGYDVIFMLDSSVPDELVFNQIQDVASNVAEELSIDNNKFRVGLMIYSSRADVIAHLNRLSKKRDIVQATKHTMYRPGDSNLADAIDYVRQNMFTDKYGDRDFAMNLIVLFTGVDQSSNPYDAFRAAEKAEREQINIYSVGFYLNDTYEIDEVSTHPLNTHRYFVNGHGDLNNVPRDLARSFDDILRRERQRPYPSTTAGVKLLCPGDPGFETNRKEVQIDKDECREVDGLCEGGECQNTIGSFVCVCPKGHRLINDRCQGDGDEVNPKCQHGFYRCPDGSCEATLFDCKHAAKDVVV